MIKRIFVFLGLLVAAAVNLNAVTVTPTRQEITLPPGGTYSGSYRVTNDFDKPAVINVATRYWYVSKEEEKTTKVTDWLEVWPSSFTFVPGETVEVKYKVKVSTSMTGMRAAMVSIIPSGDVNGGVALVISVSIFLTVQGTERFDWDFSDFRIIDHAGTTQFSVIANNGGNVHVRPVGFVKIVSKKKKEIVLNIPEGRPVYPGQTRQIIAQGRQAEVFPKAGKYDVVFHLTYGGMVKEKSYKVQIKKTGEAIIK